MSVPPPASPMLRVAILGGGTIGQVLLDAVQVRRQLPNVEIVAVVGRDAGSRGKTLAQAYGVRYLEAARLLEWVKGDHPEGDGQPLVDVVVEAASHDAVQEWVAPLLEAGVDVVLLSAGALSDDTLYRRLEAAATVGGSLLWIPSGGIGALDALKAACGAGVESVEMTTRKPPAAWRGIAYVERLGTNLDGLAEPVVLYEGPAREAVRHFPQNVNIAAALSLAGVGLDRTRVRVVADPGVRFNTHQITVRGKTGTFTITLENVPSPENPKTAWLAAYSALAALAQIRRPVRVGT